MDKDEKKKSVKTRIVSAAWQLFYEKGYDQTTVDDIIALSGTSKGSFYYYFSTKDELLGTLSNVLDDFYEELAARMEPSMNSFDKLLYLNEKAHEMIEKKIPLDLLTSLYSTQLTFKGNRHLLDKNRVYYQLITEIAEEGQKRGEIRTDKPVSEIVRYYSDVYKRQVFCDKDTLYRRGRADRGRERGFSPGCAYFSRIVLSYRR